MIQDWSQPRRAASFTNPLATCHALELRLVRKSDDFACWDPTNRWILLIDLAIHSNERIVMIDAANRNWLVTLWTIWVLTMIAVIAGNDLHSKVPDPSRDYEGATPVSNGALIIRPMDWLYEADE